MAFGARASAQSHGGAGVPQPLSNMPGAHLPRGMSQAQHAPAHTHTEGQSDHLSPDVSAPRTGVQFGPVGRWWDDRTVVKSVGLNPEQKRRMDSIFNENKPAILASYQNLLKEQSKLTSLSKSSQADKASTFAAIDAVNQARAALQKATALMYLQLRQQMAPAQIEKLEKLE